MDDEEIRVIREVNGKLEMRHGDLYWKGLCAVATVINYSDGAAFRGIVDIDGEWMNWRKTEYGIELQRSDGVAPDEKFDDVNQVYCWTNEDLEFAGDEGWVIVEPETFKTQLANEMDEELGEDA